jgi:hypothetical protein
MYRIDKSGTGLFPMGWAHYTDGLSECRLWLAILFLPIVPLKKYSVKQVHPSDAATGLSPALSSFGVCAISEVAGSGDILKTYAKWWMALLIMLLVILGWFDLMALMKSREWMSDKVVMYTIPIYIAFLFGGPIALALFANRHYRSEWTLAAAVERPSAQQGDAPEPATDAGPA